MNKQERLVKVWERKDETLVKYRSFEDGLQERSGYDLKKLKKLLGEYDLTVEDFQEYGREQLNKEREAE